MIRNVLSDDPTRPRRRVLKEALARVVAFVTAGRPVGEAGMSTAEYAIGTVAAAGFAALLWTILHSGAVQSALTSLITRALHML